MFILGITVNDRSPIPALKRELNKIKKQVMREVAEEFKRKHIPPRFAAGNSSRWRHARRDAKYLKRKRREGHGNVNLVLTGRSRRAAIHNSTASGTAQGARLKLTGMPRHFFFRRPDKPKAGKRGGTGQTGPDKVKEIKQINRTEIEQLRKFARKRMLRRIKALRGLRTKKLA